MIGCFVDIGSTFTKVRLIDMDSGELLASSQAPTTVATDVMRGFEEAITAVEEETSISRDEFDVRLATSSAAGGLRMVVVGFSPQYTLEAGNRAALGAGAKIVDGFTWYLSDADTDEIREIDPDLVLLTGGTDGGNERALPKNAESLAAAELDCPIIVAGNAAVQPQAIEFLKTAGYPVTGAENVLASGDGSLSVGDAREEIRQTFMDHIIEAKGIGTVREFVDEDIVPTPDAISLISEVLATGTDTQDGLGNIVTVDVGGATTDIHTIGEGDPTKPYVKRADDLDEPFRKRTVEGDLGIRYNATTIRSRFGTAAIEKRLDHGIRAETVDSYIEKVSRQTEWIPEDDTELLLDMGIASVATAVAADRHAGSLEQIDDAAHETFAGAGEAGEMTSDAEAVNQSRAQDRLPAKHVQVGKDLTEFEAVLGTGGVLVNNPHTLEILKNVEQDERTDPNTLLPENPTYYVDNEYLLYACGLMAASHPEAALRTANRNLKQLS